MDIPVRLTQQVKAGGCASKLPPGTLSEVLSRLPKQQHENLLVGFETRMTLAYIASAPMRHWCRRSTSSLPWSMIRLSYGRIAATNALSDVYAMGGSPMTALALVCFPQDGDLHVLEQIMRGGLSVMEEAGCVVLGGHSVRDAEMKFGYAVTGMIDPARILTNRGALPGDELILAKAIGTGVITTALKQQKAPEAWVNAAVASMTLSNRAGAEIVTRRSFDVHALTDVTGFGLMGHAREMALGSGVRLKIDSSSVPLIDGALEAVELGCIPAGLTANREFVECFVEDLGGASVPDFLRTLLYDPQTSGGLLISARAGDADELVSELQIGGYPAAIIGSVVDGQPKILLS